MCFDLAYDATSIEANYKHTVYYDIIGLLLSAMQFTPKMILYPIANIHCGQNVVIHARVFSSNTYSLCQRVMKVENTLLTNV